MVFANSFGYLQTSETKKHIKVKEAGETVVSKMSSQTEVLPSRVFTIRQNRSCRFTEFQLICSGFIKTDALLAG